MEVVVEESLEDQVEESLEDQEVVGVFLEVYQGVEVVLVVEVAER